MEAGICCQKLKITGLGSWGMTLPYQESRADQLSGDHSQALHRP